MMLTVATLLFLAGALTEIIVGGDDRVALFCIVMAMIAQLIRRSDDE